MKNKKMPDQDAGQSIVEFVLILPILLTLVFSVVDISRLTYYNSTINNACNSAIRMVSLGNTSSAIADRINSMVSPLVGTATASVSNGTDIDGNACTKIIITPSSGSSLTVYITPTYSSSLKQGDTIKIYAEYPFSYITPISTFLPSNTTIKSTYYSTVETPPN